MHNTSTYIPQNVVKCEKSLASEKKMFLKILFLSEWTMKKRCSFFYFLFSCFIVVILFFFYCLLLTFLPFCIPNRKVYLTSCHVQLSIKEKKKKRKEKTKQSRKRKRGCDLYKRAILCRKRKYFFHCCFHFYLFSSRRYYDRWGQDKVLSLSTEVFTLVKVEILMVEYYSTMSESIALSNLSSS